MPPVSTAFAHREVAQSSPVVLLPFIVNQAHEDVSWLGDFERCLAWTILADV
jgi:hypothetical protein